MKAADMTTPREDAIAALLEVTEHAIGNLRRAGREQSAAYIERELASARAALGAEAGRGTDLCPDETACKNSGHAAYIVHRWLASPETAEALARALWSLMRDGIRVKGEDGITDLPPNFVAERLLAAMRDTGR